MKFTDRLGGAVDPAAAQLLLRQMLMANGGQFGLSGPQATGSPLAGRAMPAMPSTAMQFGAGLQSPQQEREPLRFTVQPTQVAGGPPLPPPRPAGLLGDPFPGAAPQMPPQATAYAPTQPAAPPQRPPAPPMQMAGHPLPPARPPGMGAAPAGGLLGSHMSNPDQAAMLQIAQGDPNQAGLLDLFKAGGMGGFTFG